MPSCPKHPARLLAPLLALSALAALFGLGCGARERPGTPPRHVLLVTVDTLRADHLSGYLYPRPTSWLPTRDDERASGLALSIDDLMQQGVSFRQAFAPRGQTFPSVASLMTGAPPLEHGALQNGDLLPEQASTLAEAFQAAGFATAAFTANHLLVPASGIAQGFEHFVGPNGEDPDVSVISQAWQWVQSMEAASDERPWFLWLHLMGPHLPYDPAPFSGQDFASTFTDPHYTGQADGSREFLDGAYARGQALSGVDVTQVVALYDAEIARVNLLLKTFLAQYASVYDDGPQRLDETLLVFAADHGEELYQHNQYWAHSKSVYDSVLRVPLFLRHPASLTGARVLDEVVELQDVAPTLLEWFDLPLPDAMRGRSLLALTDSYVEDDWESRPSFASWRDQIFSVRTPEWRLVWNPDGVEPDENPPGAYPIPELGLFDVARDPLQLHDVSAREPEVVAELRAAILSWRAGLQTTTPVRVLDPGFNSDMSALGYGGGEEADDEHD